MRRDRLVHLTCALLGALASIVTVIGFYRPSPPPQETSAPTPFPTATPAPDPTPLPPVLTPEPEADASEIVYRTPSGKRYHRATCGHVRGKEIAVSLAEAEEQGLTPCRVCNPPPLP